MFGPTQSQLAVAELKMRRHLIFFGICLSFTSFGAASVCHAQTETTASHPGRFRTGLLPDPPGKSSEPQLIISLGAGVTPADLPEHVELTRYLPPIGSQGDQDSCVAWAVAYYAFSYAAASLMQRSSADMQRADCQFSPAFLYHMRPGRASINGMYLDDAREILERYGCATLDKMPYRQADGYTAPDASVLAEARLYAGGQAISADEDAMKNQNPRIEMYQIPSVAGEDYSTMIKAYLAQEQLPLVIALRINEGFKGLCTPHSISPDFVYDDQYGKPTDLHALTLIGYDTVKHAFRVANSWGTDWGDHGFLWISERYILAHRERVIAIRGSGPFPLGDGPMPLEIRKDRLQAAVIKLDQE